jgi:hypothetical protein
MDDHQLSNNITKLIEKNETTNSSNYLWLLNNQHGSVLNICEIITFVLKILFWKLNIFK